MCSFPPQITVLEIHQLKILSLCNMQHGLHRNPKQTFCAVEDKSPLLLSGPLICLFSCVRFADHRPKLLCLVKKMERGEESSQSPAMGREGLFV